MPNIITVSGNPSPETAAAIGKMLQSMNNPTQTQPTAGAMRAAREILSSLKQNVVTSKTEQLAQIIDHECNAAELVAALDKMLSWAQTYAFVSGIDVPSSVGPLAEDCREARAVLARHASTGKGQQ
jgi:hypothetical protein